MGSGARQRSDRSVTNQQLVMSVFDTIVNVINKLILNACHSERSEES